ncbi:organic cation transporter protein-like, partial [Anneissia japonica]|uniref:organic cation transporter protein-like n=1 Tax=Anneissia japonica TaxID=1529436 RepID=UPI00142566FA
MELDQVLTKLGEFGPYQRRVYHWYCMLTLSVAFHHLAQVFLGGFSDHWCTVPSSNTDLDCTEFRYSDCVDVDWGNDVNETQCSFYFGQNFGNETGTIECLDGYTFDHSQYTNTIQEDFGLVCDGKAKTALAQMIYFAGVLTGSVVFGSLADWSVFEIKFL